MSDRLKANEKSTSPNNSTKKYLNATKSFLYNFISLNFIFKYLYMVAPQNHMSVLQGPMLKTN